MSGWVLEKICNKPRDFYFKILTKYTWKTWLLLVLDFMMDHLAFSCLGREFGEQKGEKRAFDFVKWMLGISLECLLAKISKVNGIMVDNGSSSSELLRLCSC